LKVHDQESPRKHPRLQIVAGERVPELRQIGIVNGKKNEIADLHDRPNDLGKVLELPRIVEEIVLAHLWIEAEMFLDPGTVPEPGPPPIEICLEPEMNQRDLHKIEIDLGLGDMTSTIGIDQSLDHLGMNVPYLGLHPVIRGIIAKTAEEMIDQDHAENMPPIRMMDIGLLGICLAHLPE